MADAQGVSDQLLPRLILAALAILFVYGFAEAPPADPGRRSVRPVVAAVVGVAAYVLASRIHWYPATDGSGTP